MRSRKDILELLSGQLGLAMEILEILQADLQPKIFLQVQFDVAPRHRKNIDVGIVILISSEYLIISQSLVKH